MNRDAPPGALPMRPSARLRVSRIHRWLGLLATVPILAWIASSFVLHGVGLALPEGLQGDYELTRSHSAGLPLSSADLIPPDSVLRSLRAEGIDRIYWLRLEPIGGVPAYVVKPGPFDLESVYDARSGERLDPLPDSILLRVADDELAGSHAVSLQPHQEFNRYYQVDEVAAVEVSVAGDQESTLVLSRASGRVLRRTDPMAAWFERVYRGVHVWQWGSSVRVFTAILFTLVGLTLTLIVLGGALWWDRRDRRRRWNSNVRPARRIHGRLAPLAALVLGTQMLVGGYLWFNLGLIEPRFRGQGSFQTDWTGGIQTTEVLPSAEVLAGRRGTAGAPADAAPPVQRFEWRAIEGRRFALVYSARDSLPVVLDVATGSPLTRLTPELAAAAAGAVVRGAELRDRVESEEYWMDWNARIPTFRFRASDPDDSDVHVSQHTGEVIQRRPAIWRAFGPFLVYHTFGFTGNAVFDTILLTALQLVALAMVVSGWRLANRKR